MADKTINSKRNIIYNDIENQNLIYANQLTIRAWNNIINMLRVQTNTNASHLDELFKWLLGTSEDIVSINTYKDTDGFVQYVEYNFNNIIKRHYDDVSNLQTQINTNKKDITELNDTHRDDVDDLQTQINDIVDNHNKDKNNLEYSIRSIDNKLYSNTESVKFKEVYENGNRIATQKDITELNDTHRDDVDDLQTQINDIVIDVGDLQSKHTTDINTLNTAIATKASKEEMNEAISKMPHLQFEKVEDLPLHGDPLKIYLLKQEDDVSNTYDEYLWVNNTWELIGNTKLDANIFNNLKIVTKLKEQEEVPTTLVGNWSFLHPDDIEGIYECIAVDNLGANINIIECKYDEIEGTYTMYGRYNNTPVFTLKQDELIIDVPIGGTIQYTPDTYNQYIITFNEENTELLNVLNSCAIKGVEYIEITPKYPIVMKNHNITIENNSDVRNLNVLNSAAVKNLSVSNKVKSQLVPDVDNAYNLGSSTKGWKNLYVNKLYTYSGQNRDDGSPIFVRPLRTDADKSFPNVELSVVNPNTQVSYTILQAVDIPERSQFQTILKTPNGVEAFKAYENGIRIRNPENNHMIFDASFNPCGGINIGGLEMDIVHNGQINLVPFFEGADLENVYSIKDKIKIGGREYINEAEKQAIFNPSEVMLAYTPSNSNKVAAFAITREGKAYYQGKEIGNIITSVTYNELVNMRDGNQLTPGMFYRITDYKCWLNGRSEPEARAVGNQFDIIVQALSNNTLSEDAKACKHEGDTYFDNCNLAAWELKYSLDNDNKRFNWAKTDGRGKGVIYYMKDEYDNEVPYDFKNIQFKRYRATGNKTVCPELTNSNIINNFVHKDAYGFKTDNTTDFGWFYTFTAGADYHEQEGYKDLTVISNDASANIIRAYGVYPSRLNNIVINANYIYNNDKNDSIKYSTDNQYNNVFDVDCRNMTLTGETYNNTFEHNCENIITTDCTHTNKIGFDCRNIIINDKLYSNYQVTLEGDNSYIILQGTENGHMGMHSCYLAIEGDLWYVHNETSGYSSSNLTTLQPNEDKDDGSEVVNYYPKKSKDIYID